MFHTWCSRRIWINKCEFVRHVACNVVQKSQFFSVWRVVTLMGMCREIHTSSRAYVTCVCMRVLRFGCMTHQVQSDVQSYPLVLRTAQWPASACSQTHNSTYYSFCKSLRFLMEAFWACSSEHDIDNRNLWKRCRNTASRECLQIRRTEILCSWRQRHVYVSNQLSLLSIQSR